jgi:hypothetical protein
VPTTLSDELQRGDLAKAYQYAQELNSHLFYLCEIVNSYAAAERGEGALAPLIPDDRRSPVLGRLTRFFVDFEQSPGQAQNLYDVRMALAAARSADHVVRCGAAEGSSAAIAVLALAHDIASVLGHMSSFPELVAIVKELGHPPDPPSAHWFGEKREKFNKALDGVEITTLVTTLLRTLGDYDASRIVHEIDIEFARATAMRGTPEGESGGRNKEEGEGAAEAKDKDKGAKFVADTLLLIQQNPEWSAEKIAKAVRRSRQTLYRHAVIAQALKDRKSERHEFPNRGYRSADGDLEAWRADQA